MDTIDISDVGVAIMCDIARAASLRPDAAKQAVIDELIAKGMIVRTETRASVSVYAITSRGQHALDARGVGINEA